MIEWETISRSRAGGSYTEQARYQGGWLVRWCVESEDTSPAVAMVHVLDVGEVARATAALDLIRDHGGTDGAWHKQWVLDQVVRVLAGDRYGAWVIDYEVGEEGPSSYEWSEGIAP